MRRILGEVAGKDLRTTSFLLALVSNSCCGGVGDVAFVEVLCDLAGPALAGPEVAADVGSERVRFTGRRRPRALAPRNRSRFTFDNNRDAVAAPGKTRSHPLYPTEPRLRPSASGVLPGPLHGLTDPFTGRISSTCPVPHPVRLDE